MHHFPRHRGVRRFRFTPASCHLAVTSFLALAAVAMPGARAEERVEVVPLNYMDAREAAEIINALYANEVHAVAFPPTNALLLDMTPSGAASPATAARTAPGNFQRFPSRPTYGLPYGTPGGMPRPMPYGTPLGGIPNGQSRGPLNPPSLGSGFPPNGQPFAIPGDADNLGAPPDSPTAVPLLSMNNPEAPRTP